MFAILKLSKGELAHLVERLHGMQEVTGSIPVFSTKLVNWLGGIERPESIREGDRFDSCILHKVINHQFGGFFCVNFY